jgi:predicted metal-dependent phosphoesterase TrpH
MTRRNPYLQKLSNKIIEYRGCGGNGIVVQYAQSETRKADMPMDSVRAYCDLHTHSTYSDGTLSPRELVALAEVTGLSAIALTDHNTVSGLKEFCEAAKGTGVMAVPGVELSTLHGDKELHILALFLTDEAIARVEAYTADYVRLKDESNAALVAALRAGGYQIDYDTIKAATPDGKVNRAHIAAALRDGGFVSTIKEAFASLLSPKGGYYTPPRRPSALDTIAFIKSIGAVAVWAHPYLSVRAEEVEEFLPLAKAQGLDGIETHYVTYDEPTHRMAVDAARRYGLLQSGGSDFHGGNKPDIALGTGRGNLAVPTELYRALAAHAK